MEAVFIIIGYLILGVIVVSILYSVFKLVGNYFAFRNQSKRMSHSEQI